MGNVEENEDVNFCVSFAFKCIISTTKTNEHRLIKLQLLKMKTYEPHREKPDFG